MQQHELRDLTRLSLNQATIDQWDARAAIEGCQRAGIPWIGLWRDKVARTGLSETARLVRETGIQVSSLCRGGWFPAATATERQTRIDDNKRAIEEAAELQTKVLVLVCGPAPDRDIQAAREMVEDALTQILPFAHQHGISLGIEPLHPMYAADRSVITSLAEANQIVEKFNDAHLGVVIDTFHVWWDVSVYEQIARASGHILGFHISDWLVPLPDVLLGRGMMGDGVIELRKLRQAVDAAGYQGPIEVEIFNRAIWNLPGDDVLDIMKRRYLEHV
ncbi:sugar phosphate isomerase/epimerase family protein [Dictyobacter aurantiacus]|uniref:Xylose isomerase n=1 Tax=Dictyobacter aurantiacus TaxID=1936993 RepID=A0A401ZNH5_9CHLR|nr:sugar phosphate isomerase/epimerase family protein [Dictyobacter aurantiacus]GCE08415.1 xylose isomerase [Dictyobacter aurantiacus]